MAKSTPTPAERIQLWNKTLVPEAIKESEVGAFVGTILKQEKDLENLRGYQITSTLSMALTGAGLGRGTPIDGNEEALQHFTDSFAINELSNAVNVPTNFTRDQNEVGFEYAKVGYDKLKEWVKNTLPIWAFNQLAGNTAVSFSGTPWHGRSYSGTDVTLATGNNAATAPSTNRIVRVGGGANDQAIGSGNVMTLASLDGVFERAINATPQIEPINYGGKNVLVGFISHEQETDLMRDTSSALTTAEINLSLIQGGTSVDKTGAGKGLKGFLYRNMILIPTTYVPYGVHSGTSATISTVRRAIFCGKNAACFGFKGEGAGEGGYFERRLNGGKELQVTANLVGGLKKTVYNSEDYGVIVLSTYAATH